MKCNPAILFFLIILTSGLCAQQSGTLIINTSPKKTYAKINQEVLDLSKKNQISLPVGTYLLQLWSEGFEIEGIDITIRSDRPTVVNKGLINKTKAYSDYLEKRSSQSSQKFTSTGLKSAAVVGIGAIGYIVARKNPDIEKHYNNAKRIENKFNRLDATFAELDILQRDYNIERAAYDDLKKKHNTKVAIGIPAIVGLGYLFTRMNKSFKEKRIELEPFSEDNPFVYQNNDKLELELIGHSGSLGIAIKF